MPYSPLQVANYFIEKYGRDGGIQHMKLQKLAYLAHGWWLAYKPEPILNEKPEVWRYGPVFHSLYNVLKTFGKEPIREPQRPNFMADTAPTIPEGDDETRKLLDWIWTRYGKLSAIDLSEMTHRPDTPWQKIAERRGYKVPAHTAMDDEIIREHYKKLANELQPSE